MTKQQLIVWLNKYIMAQNTWDKRRKEAEEAKKYVEKYQTPLEKEKKSGILGSILGGIVITVLGTVPCALIFSVIWLIWTTIELFKKDLRHNPGVELLSDKVVEKAAGIVIGDVDVYFRRHEILGPMIGFLIIGAGLALILGILVAIFILVLDKGVPERNKKHEAEYKSNQELLVAMQIKYDLRKKEAAIAWNEVENLKKQSPVPEDYLLWAEEIKTLLENQRADTVKEAINILHTEWHRKEELEEMRRHNEEIERQNAQIAAEYARSADAANRAAEAAENAAYWEKQKYIDDIFDDLIK